jgi:prephenate dehydratase
VETNKPTVAFGTRNVPGALLRCLEVFERHRLNMTKLESRPTGGALWEYLFHADIELADRGHLSRAQLDRVEKDLAPHVQMIKVLGLYPRATIE